MIWYRDLEENNTGIWWAICAADGQTFYGAGGFNNLDKQHQKAEIDFGCCPNFGDMVLCKKHFH